MFKINRHVATSGGCVRHAIILTLKGAVSPIFSVTMNSAKKYLLQWNLSNNGLVLLTINLLEHRNYYPFRLAKRG